MIGNANFYVCFEILTSAAVLWSTNCEKLDQNFDPLNGRLGFGMHSSCVCF